MSVMPDSDQIRSPAKCRYVPNPEVAVHLIHLAWLSSEVLPAQLIYCVANEPVRPSSLLSGDSRLRAVGRLLFAFGAPLFDPAHYQSNLLECSRVCSSP